MKRSIDHAHDDLNDSKKKRAVESEVSQGWILPEEITASIILNLISGFSGTINEEPVLDLKLVSKSWHKIIKSQLFQGAMRILPNIAIWIVRKNLAEKMPVPIKALKSSLLLSDQECWNSVLISAHSTEILEVLTKMTGWAVGTLKWRKPIYKEIVSNRIMMSVPYFDNLQQFWNLEEFMREFFSTLASFHCYPYDCHVLFNIPQHDLIKLLIVDDLARIGADSFLHEYIIDEVLHIYHHRRHEHSFVSSWLSGLKNITLPVSGENLLLNLFRFPMAVAVLADSRDFVKLVMGDTFELAEDDLEAASKLIIPADHNQDDAGYLKLLDVYLTDEILERQSMDWMGFSKQAIKLNLERLQSLIGPNAHVRYVIRTEFS